MVEAAVPTVWCGSQWPHVALEPLSPACWPHLSHAGIARTAQLWSPEFSPHVAPTSSELRKPLSSLGFSILVVLMWFPGSRTGEWMTDIWEHPEFWVWHGRCASHCPWAQPVGVFSRLHSGRSFWSGPLSIPECLALGFILKSLHGWTASVINPLSLCRGRWRSDRSCPVFRVPRELGFLLAQASHLARSRVAVAHLTPPAVRAPLESLLAATKARKWI